MNAEKKYLQGLKDVLTADFQLPKRILPNIAMLMEFYMIFL